MNDPATYIAFAGPQRVASGPLTEVLPVLKQRFDRDPSDMVLVFDTATGRPIDFDLRGSLDEVLDRALPQRRRGPGRPRLGVVSREISLLPRHWSWLEAQSTGMSGTLRRLVARAMQTQPDAARSRRIQAALGSILSAVAGDRPHWEEAGRALYAGDIPRFESLIADWPEDIRDFAVRQARRSVATPERPAERSAAETVVIDLYRQVWNRGDEAAIASLVAPRYTIHSDPGDGWEGKTLTRTEYRQRVDFTRRAFPDIAFTVAETIAAADRVCARWSAEGTQKGDLPGLPASGKHLTFSGQTIYALKDGQVCGHWQVIDRLGFVQQLR